jgi:hypothetical protein
MFCVVKRLLLEIRYTAVCVWVSECVCVWNYGFCFSFCFQIIFTCSWQVWMGEGTNHPSTYVRCKMQPGRAIKSYHQSWCLYWWARQDRGMMLKTTLNFFLLLIKVTLITISLNLVSEHFNSVLWVSKNKHIL